MVEGNQRRGDKGVQPKEEKTGRKRKRNKRESEREKRVEGVKSSFENVRENFFFFTKKKKNISIRICSSDSTRIDQLPNVEGILAPQPLMDKPQISNESLVLYIPEVEEIRISPIIARKGYLNVLEHNSNGWKKRWVVSFPFFFFFG